MFVKGANGAVGGYNLTRSLRFRASASAYLNRTMTTPTNNLKWTFRDMVKRGKLGTGQILFGIVSIDVSAQQYIQFDGNDKLRIFHYNSAVGIYAELITTQVFRDPSAFYDIQVAYDATQATASNRYKVYVNGAQVTSFSTATYPALNQAGYINAATQIGIGCYYPYLTNSFYDGYMAELYFIDGQALTPSSFGSTNSTTGVWQPAKYTGTYGTNGFYLPFTNINSAENKILYSQQIDNAAWSKINVSVTADNTTAPDGTMTAELLTSTSTSFPRVNQSITITASTQYTLSFYAKKGTSTYSNITIYDGNGNGNRAWWNINTGVNGSTGIIGAGFSVFSPSIQNIGNGWYRCCVKFTSGASTSLSIDGISVNLDADLSLSTASGLTGYLWGLQLSASTSVPPYFPTTASPQSMTQLVGADESLLYGGYNNFVANNISLTSGVTYDSMTDVPTLTSATASNFAVLNPLDKSTNITTSDGNLYFTSASGQNLNTLRCTMAYPSTGKYYYECGILAGGAGAMLCGIANNDPTLLTPAVNVGATLYSWGYYANGNKYNNNTGAAYGATFTTGDIIGVAYDADAGSLTFYKNNVSQGTAFTGMAAGTYFPALTSNGTNVFVNFGQRPFAYTPPSGFVALNAYNLPSSTIVKGNTVMDATTYTGNGSTQTITNAAGFKPDLVWDKRRDAAGNHGLFDSVRGAGNWISSNATTAEIGGVNGVSAFNSNGFSVGSHPDYNTNGATQVAWQWQAGQGSTSSNTSGTVTSTVSVNATAGFSICTLTTPASGTCTFGHGLGVAPSLVIAKYRSSTSDWLSYHASVGNTSYLLLNGTNAATANANTWNNTSPTSSVITLGSDFSGTRSIVAYCWAEIAGFSKFGSYVGNGNADGVFVYTGFKPKYLMIKSSTLAIDWIVEDSSRNTYNVVNSKLSPNTSGAEFTGSTIGIDFLSNGFKLRGSDGAINSLNDTYIFAAFAQTPSKYSLAR